MDIEEKCKTDFVLFCKTYLGGYFTEGITEPDIEIMKVVEQNILRGKVCNFVGSLSASARHVSAIAIPIWCMYYGHKKVILVVANNPHRLSDLLVSELESNNEITRASDKRWSFPVSSRNGQIRYRDAKIFMYPPLANICGLKHNGSRPDLVISDHYPCDIKDSKSMEIKKWHLRRVMACGSYSTAYCMFSNNNMI